MTLEKWLPIAAGVFLIGMMLYGHYRGFLRQCVSIGALVITLVVVKLATPYVTDVLKENTQIRNTVAQVLVNATGLDHEGEEAEKAEETPAYQRLAIEKLNIPQSVKDALIENNNHEVYSLLGVNRFIEYVSSYLAGILINAVSSVILFLLTFIVIQLLVRWLDLIARLPIISGLNQIAGAALGLAHGLLLLWVFFIVLDLCSATPLGGQLMSQVQSSKWLSLLYEYNLLNFIFQGIIRGII